MQTLFPYPEYDESARCLRNLELANQISHTLIILDTLHEVEGAGGWARHPAIEMWRGYEAQLCTYGLAMCDEYQSRGFNVLASQERINWHLASIATVDDFEMGKPRWMEDASKFLWLQRTHRSFLLGKDKKFYAKYKWDVNPGIPLYFPKAHEV